MGTFLKVQTRVAEQQKESGSKRLRNSEFQQVMGKQSRKM